MQVALASGEGHFVDIVRKAQLGMDVPNVVCADAKGLPLIGDLHLTTEAQVKLGKMMAALYLNNTALPMNSRIILTL